MTAAIDEKLADCFNFEKACVLHCESDRLYMIQTARTDKGELYVGTLFCLTRRTIEGAMEVPGTIGLTGKAIAMNRTLVSSAGCGEMGFSAQTDNAAKVKKVENMLVIPLTVPAQRKLKERDLVGVLQLLNYKGGDISKMNKVLH